MVTVLCAGNCRQDKLNIHTCVRAWRGNKPSKFSYLNPAVCPCQAAVLSQAVIPIVLPCTSFDEYMRANSGGVPQHVFGAKQVMMQWRSR